MSLTNLLVSVDATPDNGSADVQLAYKSSDFDPIDDLDLFAPDDEGIDETTKQEVNFQVIINPEKLIPPNVKRYANPNTLFADKDTEFLDNEETTAKRQARAKRFGTENETIFEDLNDEDVRKLLSSFNIDQENVKDKEKYRLNAIYMRGVQEMSTEEIFDYYRKFSPNFIEWINDKCCNVVWNDKTNAIRAMLKASRPITTVNSTKRRKKFDDKNVSPLKRSTADKDSDSEEGVLAASDVEGEEKMDANGELFEIVDSSQHTIPPGCWRVGEKSPKSELILVRFATIDDVKMRNAEKESIYYKKYGNPNYGGAVGLISGSRKRKLRGDDDLRDVSIRNNRSQFVPRDFNEGEQDYVGDLRGKLQKNYRWEQIRDSNRRSSDEEEFSPYSDEERNQSRPKTKKLRMHMRADDVEKKMKDRRSKLRSIKNRTGFIAPSAAVAVSNDEIEEGEILFDDDEDERDFRRQNPSHRTGTDLRERLKKYRMKVTVDNTSGDDEKQVSDVDDD